MAILEEIEREAIALPKDQRLKLAQRLISSVEEIGESGVEAAWETEIARRVQSLQDGEVEPVPASTAFARLRRIAPDK